MKDKLYNPAGVNQKAPQPGIASVDTDNADERQQGDKKQTDKINERLKTYDERERRGTTGDERDKNDDSK
jgi:hypothetical protein